MISLKCIIVLFAISGLSHCLKKCGTKNKNARIFNGQDADDDQFPYYVYIEFNTKSKNIDDYEWGGALI